MTVEHITSRSNPLVSRVKKLNSKRSVRREECCFCGEGPKLLDEALKWNAELDTVIFAEGIVLPELPGSVRVVRVPPDLLRSLSDTETPQGIVFICKGSSMALTEPLQGSKYLILDGVQDPGNVGTIIRTSDAFGIDGVILCGECADPWSPKTVRSTMGAVFRLPIYESGLPDAYSALKASSIPLYATALRDDTADIREMNFDKVAVIIGSEGKGVSQCALELCSKTIKIPMVERCESLNAAIAASVVLWEMSGRHI